MVQAAKSTRKPAACKSKQRRTVDVAGNLAKATGAIGNKSMALSDPLYKRILYVRKQLADQSGLLPFQM